MVDDLRGRQGRVYPLEYLLALPLIAGMAGDGELDAAAEWAAAAPAELLIRLGAPLDREGKPRRPDATSVGRGLRPRATARHAQAPPDRRQGGARRRPRRPAADAAVGDLG